MCGIVGYLGKKPAANVIVNGLKALEYRGYDSAGLVLVDNKNCSLVKQVGRVEALEQALKNENIKNSNLAIGHTRWATHGAPTLVNAHPHSNQEETIFVVHNGIIENYTDIKKALVKEGYEFISDTDTEVIPHLIDFYYKQHKDFTIALERTLADLSGAYAIAVTSSHEPGKLFVAKLSSPLLIGEGKNEYVVASDPAAIMEHTRNVVYLEDNELAVISDKGYDLKDLNKAQAVKRNAERLDFDFEQTSLGDFPNFMLKEIYEAPQTIRSATLGRARLGTNEVKLGGLENVANQLQYIDRFVIVGCGTSYFAGLVGEYLLESLAKIPAEVRLASEFKYRDEPFSRGTAIIAISQSGETADTIAALKKVDNYGCLKLGIVNTVGSTISRITDAGVYCHAGPERAVASTKAFIAQVMVLLLISLELNDGSSKNYKPLLKAIDELPKLAEQVLEQAPEIKKIAKKYAKAKNFLYIGRGLNYPAALEGALKLKEISYIHAEGYAAGEMKHGPLALIDKDFPTFALIPDSPLADKTYSNIEEIKARGSHIIAVATKGNRKIKNLADDVIYIPKTTEETQVILEAVVMQLFSYYVARANDRDIDRPRNLAKSVTVE